MSTVLSVCPVSGCGTITEGGRCAEHVKADNRRRHRKQREQGRDTSLWQALRRAVIARDGCCLDCGSIEDLTAHLDPALNGDHLAATLDDARTLCRSCHGRVDAPRAVSGQR